MNVEATVVDVSQDCMVKKDKVLEWKDIMEYDKIRSRQTDEWILEKAEKIIENKADCIKLSLLLSPDV